jgi:hypothetical protein
MTIMAAINKSVPTHEKWAEMMRRATSEEALKLREHAILSLDQSQEWSPLVKLAEDILDERKICYRPDPDEAAVELMK